MLHRREWRGGRAWGLDWGVPVWGRREIRVRTAVGPCVSSSSCLLSDPRAADSPTWEGLQGRGETPQWHVPETVCQHLPSCPGCQ